MTKRNLKVIKIRNSEYYDMTDTFDKLYQQSVKGKIFKNLYEIISCEENIKLAYRNIRKNTGGRTSGVDGYNINDLNNVEEEIFIRKIQNRMKNYQPKRVKRIEIPKPNGKTRPLGIPSIWDRIVQQCFLQVLEPICEAKFFERSNGFRPNRSVEHAIAQSYKFMQMYKLHYVVDVDIKGFFDNVDHGKLIKQLWTLGIQDKRVLAIISKMLKAEIKMPNGQIVKPTKGTPQGGILSPLLANVVLNELDWWVANQWELFPAKNFIEKPRPDGKGTNRSSKYRLLERSNLKKCFITRYADDFKIFCLDYQTAEKVKFATTDFLNNRLHLEVSEEKTKITNLEREYSEFLGFKMKVVRQQEKWIVKSHMCDKAIQRTKDKLKEAIGEIKATEGNLNTKRAIDKYNSIVYGVHQYFRLATMISEDMGNISYQIQHICKGHKLKRRINRTGKHIPKYIKDEYGNSSQLRYINDQALIPVGYCKHKNPMYKKRKVNKYTKEGREAIHKTLSVNTGIMKYLMEHPVKNRSIEYNDNRISLYCAQKGRCAITKEELRPNDIQCHHKIPRSIGGTDEYSNLIIVHKDVHTLIHAENEVTIEIYLKKLSLMKNELEQLNKLRVKIGLNQIGNLNSNK